MNISFLLDEIFKILNIENVNSNIYENHDFDRTDEYCSPPNIDDHYNDVFSNTSNIQNSTTITGWSPDFSNMKQLENQNSQNKIIEISTTSASSLEEYTFLRKKYQNNTNK